MFLNIFLCVVTPCKLCICTFGIETLFWIFVSLRPARGHENSTVWVVPIVNVRLEAQQSILSSWLVTGKLLPLPLLTNSFLVLDVDICRCTGDLRSVWMHRHMTFAALWHCRLWIDVFIYVFQQGQNKVGLSNSEVAQYIILHRYEWKQEVHTDFWWWNDFGLLWKKSASVLLPSREMFKTVAFSVVRIVCIGWICVQWSFFSDLLYFERSIFFGSVNFSCFCSSFRCHL